MSTLFLFLSTFVMVFHSNESQMVMPDTPGKWVEVADSGLGRIQIYCELIHLQIKEVMGLHGYDLRGVTYDCRPVVISAKEQVRNLHSIHSFVGSGFNDRY